MIRARHLPNPPRDFWPDLVELGLTVTAYRNEAVTVDTGRRLWLPRDLVGQDGKTVIIWREADRSYSVDGWEPWHDGMHGGRRQTIGSALAWVRRARDIRAGRASDFLGC